MSPTAKLDGPAPPREQTLEIPQYVSIRRLNTALNVLNDTLQATFPLDVRRDLRNRRGRLL